MIHLQNPDEAPPVPPRRRDLSIEILRLVSATITLAVAILGMVGKFPSLAKPWIWNVLVGAAVLFLLWLVKPRLSGWRSAIEERKRERQFIKNHDERLRELVDRFGQFISDNNTQSLLYLIRNGYPHMTGLEEVLTTDFIGSWFHSYREQLASQTEALHPFLARCREFGNLVQQFNSHYVLRTEKLLAVRTISQPDEVIGQLEAFREEYNDFLRNVERWAKGINSYLQSLGITSHPALWNLAPTTFYAKPKSFGIKQPALK
jgi:hypothetical protein